MARTEDSEPADAGDHEDPLDKLRVEGIGVRDPNIVGDAGPFDVAPGHDPDLPDAWEQPQAGT